MTSFFIDDLFFTDSKREDIFGIVHSWVFWRMSFSQFARGEGSDQGAPILQTFYVEEIYRILYYAEYVNHGNI